MKKIFLALLIGTCFCGSLNAQWLNVFYPELKRVVFPTATTGYAIGSGGELLKTIDGGANWILKSTPLSKDLFSIYFFDSDIGFIGGGSVAGSPNKLYRTVDGGESWSNVTLPGLTGTAVEVVDISFFGSLIGYIFGPEFTGFWKTADGGLSWTRLPFSSISVNTPKSIKSAFISESIGFFIQSNGPITASSIYKTTDGGFSWNQLNFPGQTLRSIYAVDATTIYACGTGSGQGLILKSTNGGATYSTQVLDQPDIYDIQFTDSNTGFAYGGMSLQSAWINKTTDGGANWGSKILVSSSTTSGSFSWDLQMINSNLGFALDERGEIIKTTDGWNTYTDSYSKPIGELTSIYFSDSQTGFAAGRNSSFLKTIDGAKTWDISNSLSSYLINSIYFTSTSTGYAVGDNGAIIKTSDNGTNWSPLTSSTTSNLNGVTFIDANSGLGVGTGGTIMKTTDAGANWTAKTSNTSNELKSISQNSGLMIAVGASGTLLKSTDGGETWTAKPSNQTVSLNSVQVISATLAFVGGDGGKILKSTNGGESWSQLFTNTSNNVRSIYFFDSNNGVAAVAESTQAIILRTSDGGGSWSIYNIPNSFVNTTSNLNSIFSPSPTGSVAVGAGGRVYTSVCSNPIISNQPGSQTLTAGQALNLAVTATGTGTLSYQWARDGVNLGTNSSLLSISSISANDAGSYTVTVSDGCGLATSNAAIVNVLSEGPAAQPTALMLTGASNTSATFSFTAATGSPDGYFILRRGGSAVSDAPVDGITYVNGTVIGNSVVVSSGSETSFDDNGLTTGTIYYYAIFAYKGSNTSINYLTTTPLTGIAQSAEPINHISNIDFSNISSSSITITFSAALGTPSGYIVVRRKDAAPIALPSDAAVYSINSTLGDAQVVSVGASTTFIDNGLEAGTRYYYKVFPYNGVGVSTNYLITNSSSNVGIGITLPTAPTAISAINILFDSFTARWGPVTGADKYSLDVSELNDFTTFVTGFQGRETTELIETVTGLKINSNYYYRVRALNTSGPSASSNTITLKTNDVPVGTLQLQMTTPLFTATFPTDEQQQKITVTLSGGLGSRVVTLYYRGVAENDFSTVSANTVSNNVNQYEATVTRAMIGDYGIEFYLVAKDAAFTAESQKFTIRKSYSGTNSPPIPISLFGGKLESYQIISIPIQLEDNLIQSIFGSVLGEYDDTKWRVLHYQNGGYAEYPTINKIELGKSYWFNSRAEVAIKTGVGSDPDFNQSKPFKMSLDVGWNQIATPFPFAVDWDDVLAANGNPSGVGKYKVYSPSTISFSESNSLKPFSGGFVFADAAKELNLPVTLKTTAGGRSMAPMAGSDIGGDEWLVPITVLQGKVINSLGGIGMHPNAKLSKDDFDDITLPRFIKYLEFNSYHHDFIAPRFSRDIVPTSDEFTWNIIIESNIEQGNIILNWAEADLGNNNAQLILYDPGQEIMLDMKRIKTFQISNTSHKSIQIFYFGQKTLDINETIMLGRPYPNPSLGEVNFNLFSLSQSQARLEIFDMMGNKVHQSGNLLEGKTINTLIWPGTDLTGQKVSAGLYLYKLVTFSNSVPKTNQGRIIIH